MAGQLGRVGFGWLALAAVLCSAAAPTAIAKLDVPAAAGQPADARDDPSVLEASGRFADAELVRRARIRDLGTRAVPGAPEEKALFRELLGLAFDLDQLGQYDAEEPIARQALALQRRFGPDDDAALAEALLWLGNALEGQERYADAEAAYRESLAHARRAGDAVTIASSLNNVGFALWRQRDFAAAEASLTQARQAMPDAMRDTRDDAAILYCLALVHRDRGDLARALETVNHAIAIADRVSSVPQFVAPGRYLAAQLHAALGNDAAALADIRIAADLLQWRARASQAQQLGKEVKQAMPGLTSIKEVYDLHIALLHRLEGASKRVSSEPFELAQAAELSSSARAVTGAAARFAAGTDALAAAVRQRQDLAQRWQRLDHAIVQADPGAARTQDGQTVASVKSELDATATGLAALDGRIARDFPRYAELIKPVPLSLRHARALLAPHEALLVYFAGADATWLWVLRHDRAEFHRIDIGAAQLAAEIAALRARLDPGENPDLLAYPLQRAYALHQRILAPANRLLAGARHVFVVPDGALQTLPMGVLVTDDPKDRTDYRGVAWLARRYAITVLPSVSSLRALRAFARAAPGSSPFFGVGDPVLDGTPGDLRGVRTARLFRGAVADVSEVRQLPALPDTAVELKALARAHGVGDDVVYLGTRAREATIKRAPLARFRTIAFATHGLIAGEVRGLAEPALVLTPPSEATAEDDGLLTASEIAQLKLNADWIILSACNTAAGDGAAGAEGLSGLARAFFYAGSRALLVSHWPVETRAAVLLTTRAFEALRKAPAIGRGEALRRAEMALLDDRSLPVEFTHPMIWSPFVVVGEGGPGR